MKANPELHKQVVQKFLETKAIDFAAAGKAIAELGPSVSLMDDPELVFCGTMRTFFHCYQIPGVGSPIENLGELRAAVNKL